MVAEPDKVLVGELNGWVANPLGPGQTSALQIRISSMHVINKRKTLENYWFTNMHSLFLYKFSYFN